jgi:hypothetical protein
MVIDKMIVDGMNLDQMTCYQVISELFLSNSGMYIQALNTKGGSITVMLTSCLTGLELAV